MQMTTNGLTSIKINTGENEFKGLYREAIQEHSWQAGTYQCAHLLRYPNTICVPLPPSDVSC